LLRTHWVPRPVWGWVEWGTDYVTAQRSGDFALWE
jgi:hypothetical protein